MSSIPDFVEKRFPEDVKIFAYLAMEKDHVYRHGFQKIMASGSPDEIRQAKERDAQRISGEKDIMQKYGGVYTEDELRKLIFWGMWASR